MAITKTVLLSALSALWDPLLSMETASLASKDATLAQSKTQLYAFPANLVMALLPNYHISAFLVQMNAFNANKASVFNAQSITI